MKSATEVLLMKELELQRIKREIEALRIAARLLGDEQDQPQSPASKSAKIVQLP